MPETTTSPTDALRALQAEVAAVNLEKGWLALPVTLAWLPL